MAFLQWLLRLLNWLFQFQWSRVLPVLLTLYLVGSAKFFINIVVFGLIMVHKGSLFGPSSLALGLGLFIPFLFLLCGFTSSLVTCWFYTWLHAPFWRPDGQLSHSFGYRFLLPLAYFNEAVMDFLESRNRSRLAPRSVPPRWQHFNQDSHSFVEEGLVMFGPINHCVRQERWGPCNNAHDFRPDRAYHAVYPKLKRKIVNHCLPAWDHYCHWLISVVYLHTTKPYMLTIMYLMAYASFVSVVFCWASTQARFKHIRFYILPLAVASWLLVLHLTWYVLYDRLRTLVYYGMTDYEKRYKHDGIFTMAFPIGGGCFVVGKPPCNPWDQGSFAKNWTHIMGEHWWEWLVPFWQPRRVRDYDDPSKPGFDEKFGEEFLAWTRDWRTMEMVATRTRDNLVQPPAAAVTRARRVDAWSSGSDIPLGDIRRRAQNSDDMV